MPAVAPRRTQQERRETTIRKLLDAATETLIEVGHAEASVQRICERAELSQGALFRHFPNREALMVAVGEHVGAQILARVRRQFAALSPEDEDLGAAIELVRDACRSRLNQAWYELSMAARTNATLRKGIEPVARRYFDDITALARELLPGLAARFGPAFDVLVTSVIALFDGEAVHRYLLREPALEKARLELLVAAMSQLTRATP